MTSNQLQYASNKIQQQIADENERHNTAVEDETRYRDLYEEEYKQKSVEIQKQVADETERHNKEMEDIQRRYNELYIEMQTATYERQDEIRRQLADLEAYKADVEAQYKEDITLLEGQKNMLEQERINEMKRSNKASEGIQTTLNELKEKQIALESRIADNQAMYWSGQLANDIARNNIQLMSTQNAWNLGLYQTQLGMYDLQQRMLEWKTKQENIESETFRNLLNGVTSSVESLTRSTMNVLGALTFTPQNNLQFKFSTNSK